MRKINYLVFMGEGYNLEDVAVKVLEYNKGISYIASELKKGEYIEFLIAPADENGDFILPPNINDYVEIDVLKREKANVCYVRLWTYRGLFDKEFEYLHNDFIDMLKAEFDKQGIDLKIKTGVVEWQ